MRLLFAPCFAPCFALCLALPAAALAQIPAPPPSISVSGTATLSVPSDMVDLNVSVQTVAKTLDQAVSENDRKMKAVIAVIRAHGVGDADLRTAHMQIHEERERGEKIGEAVVREVHITLRDLTKLEPLMRGMLGAGVNRIGSIELGTSKAIELKDRARLEAMAAAKRKAIALAGAIDQGVGKAIHISETPSAGPGPRVYDNFAIQADHGGASGTTIATGQVSIRMTVYATFALN